MMNEINITNIVKKIQRKNIRIRKRSILWIFFQTVWRLKQVLFSQFLGSFFVAFFKIVFLNFNVALKKFNVKLLRIP
jgi:hypothetical protein